MKNWAFCQSFYSGCVTVQPFKRRQPRHSETAQPQVIASHVIKEGLSKVAWTAKLFNLNILISRNPSRGHLMQSCLFFNVFFLIIIKKLKSKAYLAVSLHSMSPFSLVTSSSISQKTGWGWWPEPSYSGPRRNWTLRAGGVAKKEIGITKPSLKEGALISDYVKWNHI